MFEVMTSPELLGSLGSVAFVLEAILSKGWIASFLHCFLSLTSSNAYTVDSRYLEFDGTMDNIRVNRSSTQEELRRYRKCGLLNNERETTRAKF